MSAAPLAATPGSGSDAEGVAVSSAAQIPVQQSEGQSVSPATSAPTSLNQPPVAALQRQQTSGTVSGCLGAALIAVGFGLLLLSALVIVGMILDQTKTTRATIGGIVGGGTMILFSVGLIAVGTYVIRQRRRRQSARA